MPKHRKSHITTMAERLALIAALPCFSTLTLLESEEFVTSMTDVSYLPGKPIVTEGELVDSVYIIVSGQAEVTHQEKIKTKIIHKVKIKKVPIATLEAGEAIGLNDTGFFSTTGQRTATVTAITEVHALRLDLKLLHQFLEKYSHLQKEMHAVAVQMLRMQLIKQSLPFSQLSHERLIWLAEHVEEFFIPAGGVIFNQGDVGDRCYLIRSGQVEIVEITDEVEHHLAILKSPTLFGEATLITNSPRNATARAKEDTHLLALRHEYLSELLETENGVANMFMTLMVDRSRPLQNPHIVVHERTTADDQHVVILKNPDNGKYFKLSEEGWFIWQQLDGKQTMQEVTLALADQFNVFAPDVVAALISKLAKAKFIINVEIVGGEGEKHQARWSRAVWRVRCLLEKRVAIGDSDKWLTRVYKKYCYHLFTPVGKIVLALIALSGFGAFIFSAPHIINVFKTIPNSLFLFILIMPFTMLSVAFHEMGHALATKSFGFEVHYMGVGWYWLGPVAFTDTSDMWLSTRWPRTVVNLAGVYTDSLFAAVCSILIFVIPFGYVQGFLWLLALFTYINALRMLSPLQELDGYYVLMDLVDKPRLRQSAVTWLVRGFPKALRKPSLFKENIPEVSYWLACIVFLILITVMTLLVQGFVLKILGLHSKNILISLAAPLIVVLITSFAVIAEIRNKAEE